MGAALGPIIGAAIGLVKQGEQKRQHEKELEIAAARTRLEPLLNPRGVQRLQDVSAGPSVFNNVLAGAIAGNKFQQENPSLFGGGTNQSAPPTEETLLSGRTVGAMDGSLYEQSGPAQQGGMF